MTRIPADGIPVISLAGLRSGDDAERRAVAAALGQACREIGFFYAVDHGVEAALCDRVFEQSRRFFQLPVARKEILSIRQSRHNRGYIALADERLNPEQGADQKEAFNIGVDLPLDHPDVVSGKPFRGVNYWPDLSHWKADMLAYFDACLQVGRLLHRGFSLDLGLPETYFDRHLVEPIATLRLLRYPPLPPGASAPRLDAGAGTHTDYGNITLLATDTVAGLQVANRQGQWIDAPYVEGALVCNIGDCLMRWTNDLYVSTPHRVKAPAQERYSVAFFLEVDPDAVVDSRDLFPQQAPKYPPITCADYLAQQLNATYGYRKPAP
ncbi:isopenicillin N synthase family dioxygenase [Ketobacter sp.]|uniref:isopenicillin N synthase family dioxygenase n=1 Tax=Ketobacter sp. TaxID=2083498 RepID=UPI000F188326|nr:2-oxoglutarate and iron-dependent oxygenase domain-containing protein [Ketobacter sp.]RLT92080.1 MAG: isopenicillin N synthase family oxygenase [Ketobacter sp.]